MSGEPSERERRLERVTAPECPAHLLLDPETAALREGWLALGELLEAAQPMRHAATGLPELPGRPVRAGWRLAWAAAVAASVLLGTAAWHWGGGDRHGGASSLSDELAVGTEALETASNPSRPARADDRLPWDDPLDEQIASVAQRIVRAEQDWNGADDVFGPVYYGVEELEGELDESTL